MMVLTFMLFEAIERSKLPPYQTVEAGQVEVSYAIDLKHCIFLYLWVAFLCSVLIVYCLHTMPRKRALIRKYLEEGVSTLGDVFYPEDQTCYGLNAQYGTVTYGHPNSELDHAYIRRSVRLFQNFSREWVPILLLPSRPFSGHAKADLEMAYLSAERQKSALSFLAIYSSVWLTGNLGAAIYVLRVVRSNKYEDEFPRGWMWLGICVAAMPILSIGANFLTFQRYMRWMTKGDARLLQGTEKGPAGDKGDPSNYEQMADDRHGAVDVEHQRSLD